MNTLNKIEEHPNFEVHKTTVTSSIFIKLFKGKRAMSLLEVAIATFVFLVAAIPIYKALSVGSAREIEAVKLSTAGKILDSFRSEMMSRPFKELAALNPSGSETFVPLQGGYPVTLQKVLDIQTKYKDFKLKPEIRFSPGNHSVLEFKAAVTWTSADGSERKEENAFLVVQP